MNTFSCHKFSDIDREEIIILCSNDCIDCDLDENEGVFE